MNHIGNGYKPSGSVQVPASGVHDSRDHGCNVMSCRTKAALLLSTPPKPSQECHPSGRVSLQSHRSRSETNLWSNWERQESPDHDSAVSQHYYQLTSIPFLKQIVKRHPEAPHTPISVKNRSAVLLKECFSLVFWHRQDSHQLVIKAAVLKCVCSFLVSLKTSNRPEVKIKAFLASTWWSGPNWPSHAAASSGSSGTDAAQSRSWPSWTWRRRR